MSSSTERNLATGFGLALIVLVINAGISLRNVQNLVGSGDWVIHTREVLGEVETVIATLRETQVRHRNFIITGRDREADLLNDASLNMIANIELLKRLTSDNNSQQTKIDEVRRRAERFLEILQADSEVRRKSGFAAAQASLASAAEDQAFAALLQSLTEVKSAENLLLVERTRTSSAGVWWAFATTSIATVLALGMLATSFSLVRRDVSERKRSEKVLRLSEARKAAMLNSALDAIITIDHEGTIVEFNPAAEQTFGLERTAAVGRNMAELIVPPSLRAQHYLGLDHYRATGEGPLIGRRVEVPALRSDGSEFSAEVAISAIETDGQPMFTAYLRDISEKKRGEAEAHERTRLATLAAQVGTAIIKGENLSDILTRCCEGLVSHLDGAFARVWTFDPNGNMLVLQASAGMYTHTDGAHSRIPVGRYKIGLIGEQRVAHLSNDVLNDPYIGDHEWAQREGMVAFAGYPLTVEDRLVGVLAMFARHTLSESALQAMATMANGIALSIERKQAEIELRESEEQVRLLLDSSGEGIYGVDTSGCCTFCNPVGSRLLGYDDPRELLGKNMHELVHHTQRDGQPHTEVECRIFRAAHSGEGVHADDEVFWKRDGTAFPVDYQSRPIYRDSHRLGAVVTFADITERRRVEETMRLRDRSLAAISQGLFITDPLRSDEPIVYVNSAFERMTGYAQAEVAGRDIGLLQGSGTDGKLLAELREAFANRRNCTVELLLARKDQTAFWASVSVSVVQDPSGRATHFVGVMTDITEHKRAEEELLAAKEAAEAASRSKSTFLANMSHELRTPLNAIIGYSEMLQEENDGPGSEELISDLGRIHGAGKHLLGLINDILDLSKIEAGKLDLYLESFSIPEMIRGVVGTIRPLIEKNGNTLEVVCPEELGTMRADLTKVRQALLNLLSNASKFTEKGTVWLTVSSAPADGRDWLSIEVRDSGIGMKSEQIGRLFQPFMQADSSTTRKYGGTGLGLMITRRFCQMMGGDIAVKSAEDCGSTFTIRLPVEVPELPSELELPDTIERDSESHHGRLVLVIDDDPTVSDLMRRTLEKDGFRVQYAPAGERG